MLKKTSISRTFTFAAVAAAAVALTGVAQPASAGVTQLSFQSGDSIENTGVTFDGTLSYDDAAKLLTVNLSNTSSFQSVITGFYFNVAGNATIDYNVTDDAGTAGVLESAFDNDNTLSPFGTFDGGVFLQDLSMQQVKGIDEGETGIFTFDIDGPDAGSLTAGSFFSETNDGGGLESPFFVRYQSVGDRAADSDKVGAVAVPLPPAAWAALLTMGVAGMTRLRKRVTA